MNICNQCGMITMIEPSAQPTSAEHAQGYAEGFNDACRPAEPDNEVNRRLSEQCDRLGAERDAYMEAADKLAAENKVLRDAQPVQPVVTHITWNDAGVRTVNGVPDYAQPVQPAITRRIEADSAKYVSEGVAAMRAELVSKNAEIERLKAERYVLLANGQTDEMLISAANESAARAIATRDTFAKLAVIAEQDRCVWIIYSQCASVNSVQSTVDAIRSRS